MTRKPARRVLACFLGISVVAGCAPFPEGPPLIGYDPTPYGDAFRAAAAEEVIRRRLGQGFYEAFGDKAYTIGTSALCTEDTLQAFLSMERGCALLIPGDNPDCRELNLCIRLRVDPVLFADLAIRTAIEAALLRPCDALTPPQDVSYGRSPSVIGKPASASWRLLRCEGHQVVGSDIAVQETASETVISLTFKLS